MSGPSDDLQALLLHMSPFPPEDLVEEASRFHARMVERRTPLVGEGEVCRSFHFVRSGCYLLIRAPNDAEALRIAQACPILEGEGTNVEVRELSTPR